MRPIILASGSPRRKELMALLAVPYTVQTEEVEEKVDKALTPEQNVCLLAEQKAQAVAKKVPHAWVIGCDTVVVYDGHILGKPVDGDDACHTLAKLSGKVHEVYTGVCLMCKETGEVKTFHVASQVKMKQFASEEIKAYVATGEPMDKAGSYGIQGRGSILVEGIVGDYFNIVGLPVSRLYDVMKEIQMISL